jgi:hypothetical protein
MFALDAFTPGLTIWKQLAAFFMHLIPSFILLIFLLVAWKWELTGGIIFTVIGIILSPVVFQMNYKMNHSFWLSTGIILSITVPFIIVGIMFILSSYLKKRDFSG